ncbi:MAG TPA: glycosyltransferase family 4 protein [Candidatus Sulfotelmatobacter sp.]|nr:glycosyltransferase family 4 protein [Candidatus Sulfotelmatobacter sp.]
MRILLAPSAYYPNIGGIEETTLQLARALTGLGHEIQIVTHGWGAGGPRSETRDGFKVTRLSLPLPSTAARFAVIGTADAARLLTLVRRFRPDVVHAIGGGHLLAYLVTLRRLLGAPLVFTAQGLGRYDAYGTPQRGSPLRAGLRRVLAEGDHVTACSAYILDGLAEVGPILAPSSVILNGVEPADFAGHPPEKGLERSVLAVGRLVDQKAFDVLLEAFRSERLAGLSLVIAGDGIERERLEAQAAQPELRDRVRFLGAADRARIASLLHGARLFAFPSRYEPFGIALLEAMAVGVPAVATATGGILDFARDEENAVLVPPDDPDALAAAIARVDADDDLRQRLVAGGRETAAELTWSRLVDRYLEVYISAAS